MSYGTGENLLVFANVYIETEEPVAPGGSDATLANTGDSTIFTVALTAAAGIAAVGAGVFAVTRKRGE